MLLRVWAFLLIVAVTLPAQAQISQHAALVSGLEAQYRAAIVRERRLADAREIALITDAETRMRSARAVLAAARGDRAAAQRELDSARAEFVRLVSATPINDSVARIELEAFRAEVEGRLPEATPEMLAAYQQFADGDRTRAWAQLEPLLTARANARRAAAAAVAGAEMRQLAQLRDVMRLNGEATTADVMTLWVAATEIDPSNFSAQILRSRLTSDSGDIQGARRALDVAERLIVSDNQRVWVLSDRASLARLSGNIVEALRLNEQALAVYREYAAAEPENAFRRNELATGLVLVSTVAQEAGMQNLALRNLEEAVTIRRALVQSFPDNALYARALAGSLKSLSRLRGDADPREALRLLEEAIAITRRLGAAQPANGDLMRDLISQLTTAANTLARIEEHDRALLNAREAHAIARQLLERDPTFIGAKQDVVEAGRVLAAHLANRGDDAEALAVAAESLSLMREITASDGHALLQSVLGHILIEYADGLRNADDYVGAERAAAEAAEVFRRASRVDPANRDMQDGLADSLDSLVRTRAVLRDWPRGIAAAQHSVEVRRALDRGDRTGRRQLSVALEVLGNIQFDSGDIVAAVAPYAECLALRRDILAADPQDLRALDDLSIALQNIGSAYTALGRHSEALGRFEEALALLQERVRRTPNYADANDDLASGLTHLGDALRAQGRAPQALAHYRNGLAVATRAEQLSPQCRSCARRRWLLMQRLLNHDPRPPLTWAEFVRHLEDLDGRAMLSESDRPMLENARQRAAEQRQRRR